MNNLFIFIFFPTFLTLLLSISKKENFPPTLTKKKKNKRTRIILLGLTIISFFLLSINKKDIKEPIIISERNNSLLAISYADDTIKNSEICIDINNAEKEELITIKHISEKRAEDLISLRPFQSLDDLMRIKGIGPARLDDIKEQGLACVK